MKARLSICAALPLLAWGCSVSPRSAGPAPARPGVPLLAVDPAVIGPQPSLPDPAVRLPERITLPAAYRLLMLDGHLTLVRETDSQALEPAPASMRIVTGEIARGELGYQPALLPQELAAEVAANRESAARMDNALASVMERSRELSEQALAVEAQSRKLAEMLQAAQARIRDLEAPGALQKAAAKADAGDARE
jgi:hypothetical protein